MFDLKLVTVALFAVCVLYMTPVDPGGNLTEVEGIYFNVSKSDLFDFITEPDVFSLWFRWPSRVSHADQKPLVVGKRYYVRYLKVPLVFEVRNVKENSRESSVVLEASTFLRPKFKLQVYRTCSHLKYHRLKVKLSLDMDRRSMLFNVSIGSLVGNIARRKMVQSLDNLESILNNFNSVAIHNSF